MYNRAWMTATLGHTESFTELDSVYELSWLQCCLVIFRTAGCCAVLTKYYEVIA
jgi:hypothetical protein